MTNSEQNIAAINTQQTAKELFTNAFFAYGYAQIVLRNIQDNITNNLVESQTPIYIFNFGDDSGKFSYLFLRKLADFLQHYKINNYKICYVITDSNSANLQILQTSPFFAEFIQQGILDFANYQSGQNEIKLLLQNTNLNLNELKNPSIIIANNIEVTTFPKNNSLLIVAKKDLIPSTKEQSEERSIQGAQELAGVNLDALCKSVESVGGAALMPAAQEGFKIGIFSIGQQFAQLPNTTWAYDHFYSHCSSSEYLRIKDYMINNPDSLDLDNILSLLKLSYWDPAVLLGIAKPLAKIINQATPGYINTLKTGLTQVGRNYYFTDAQNLPFELGHLYHLIGDLAQAYICYNLALRDYGESSPLFFNLGLCNYYKHDTKAALECFKKAVALDGENQDAKNWVEHITKEQAES